MSKRVEIALGIVVAAVAISVTVVILFGGGEPDRGAPQSRLDGEPTFKVRTGGRWSIIRNGPAGLAIGNARTGWEVVGRSRSSFGYVLGYVRGTDEGPDDFAGCAWIAKANLVKVGRDRDAACDWLNYSRNFMSRINCRDCAGGTKVKLIRSAGQFANYSKRFGLKDRLRTVPAGRCVEWRWISKAGGAVMVKDRRFPNQFGSWVFIRRSALPEELPSGKAVACPTGNLRPDRAG